MYTDRLFPSSLLCQPPKKPTFYCFTGATKHKIFETTQSMPGFGLKCPCSGSWDGTKWLFLPSNRIALKFTRLPKISARLMSSSYPTPDRKPVLRAVKDRGSLQRGKMQCLTMFQMNKQVVLKGFQWLYLTHLECNTSNSEILWFNILFKILSLRDG